MIHLSTSPALEVASNQGRGGSIYVRGPTPSRSGATMIGAMQVLLLYNWRIPGHRCEAAPTFFVTIRLRPHFLLFRYGSFGANIRT